MQENGRGKKVCIVRHSFYPWELNVKREAETLLRNGFHVTVICLREKGEKPHELVEGVEIFRMPVGHKRGSICRYIFEYNAFFILAFLKLFFLHLKKRFDFVQVNTMPDALVFCALVPKLTGARVLLHMHEPMPELFCTLFPSSYARLLVPLMKVVERLSMLFADRVLTVTREMRDNFGKRGADVNKITVIVNVPDDELFDLQSFKHVEERVASRRKENRRKGIFTLVSHGAIERRYGYDLVVRALKRLEKDLPGARFHFMGKGDHLEEVVRLAEELKIAEKVVYLGFLPFERMVEEILSSDVGLVPVRKNPYSNLVHTNKMYEYMALDKPIIATRLDALLSYFPEDTLLYFTSEDVEDLASKIFHAFAHPEETEERVRKTRAVYDAYKWEREKKKYLNVYRSLL